MINKLYEIFNNPIVTVCLIIFFLIMGVSLIIRLIRFNKLDELQYKRVIHLKQDNIDKLYSLYQDFLTHYHQDITFSDFQSFIDSYVNNLIKYDAKENCYD